MRLVNTCGVVKEQFIGGKCNACGRSECDMSDDRLIDERIYNYARKYTKLPGGMFNVECFINGMRENGRLEKAPKYIIDYVSAVERLIQSKN